MEVKLVTEANNGSLINIGVSVVFQKAFCSPFLTNSAHHCHSLCFTSFAVFLGEPFLFPCGIFWKKSKKTTMEFTKMEKSVA